MKKKPLILLAGLFCFAQMSYAEGSSLQSKLNTTMKLQYSTPNSVAEQANKMPSCSSPYSEVFNDPLVNSMLGSYSNMMQGASGGIYSPQEQQKQQLDYAKQQTNNDDGQ